MGLGHVLRRVVGGREMEDCNLVVNPRYNPNDDDRYGRRNPIDLFVVERTPP